MHPLTGRIELCFDDQFAVPKMNSETLDQAFNHFSSCAAFNLDSGAPQFGRGVTLIAEDDVTVLFSDVDLQLVPVSIQKRCCQFAALSHLLNRKLILEPAKILVDNSLAFLLVHT